MRKQPLGGPLTAVALACAVTLALTGCSSSKDDAASASPTAGPLIQVDPNSPLGLPRLIGLEPKVRKETVVLDSATSPVSGVTITNPTECAPSDPARVPCEFELTIPALPTGITTGSVLVSDVTPTLPNGLLVKVTAITGNTVKATEATLGDALEQGEFRVERAFTPADVRSVELAPGVTATGPTAAATAQGAAPRNGIGARRGTLAQVLAGDPGGLGFGFDVDHVELADGVYADGHVGFDVSCGAYGGLTWETYLGVPVYPDGVYFQAKCGVTQDASLSISATQAASLEVAKQIGTINLDAITFFVGPVPIVLIPHVTITATASGEVKASMTFGATEHFGVMAGIDYNDGFHLIKDFSFDFSSTSSNLDTRLSATAGVRLAQGLMLYGLVGPQLTEDIYANLEAKPPGERPIWCIKGGISAGVSLHIDLGFKDLDYGPAELFSDSTDLGCAANIAPTVRMQTSAGTYVLYPASTSQPPQVTAYSDDAEEGSVPITWSEGSNVLGSSASGQPFSFTMLGVGMHTITVTATDTDGATASTTITVDARKASPTSQILVQNASGQWVDAGSLSGTTGGAIDVRIASSSPIGLQVGTCLGATWSGGLTVTSLQGCDYRISLSKAGSFVLTATSADADGNSTADQVTITVANPAPGSPPSFTPVAATNTSVSPSTALCDGCGIDWGQQVKLQTMYTNWAQAGKSVKYVWEVRKSSSGNAGTWTVLSGTDGTPNSSSFRTWTAPQEYKSVYTFTFRVTASDASSGAVYYTDTFALTYSGPPA